MPDPTQDPNKDQDQDRPYQLTPGDLSELHGIARQLEDVGDPRAARIWNLLSAQSGDESAAPKVTLRQSPVQATSWQDDLENELGGSEAAGAGSKAADFLDNLSDIGRQAYFSMRDPDPPAYKAWRGQNFVRNSSGSYVSSDGEAYSNAAAVVQAIKTDETVKQKWNVSNNCTTKVRDMLEQGTNKPFWVLSRTLGFAPADFAHMLDFSGYVSQTNQYPKAK